MRSCSCRSIPLFCLLLLLVVAPVRAEEAASDGPPAPAAERPVIGLALGGGGARGIAHIGVLQRLDELRVPVDRIAGTSMGAIVGMLFALGLTPEEIEAKLDGIDWRELMRDRPPRSRLSYRRKTDDMLEAWPFEMGFDGTGLDVQRAMIAGQNLPFAFAAPGAFTSGWESFDDLRIPYRAVATDVISGESVVLERGNLLRSVRASMSVPGAFPPVSIDGRLLVDGFLLRNLPVDVVRGMGADKVIGVTVAWSPGETELADLNSLPGVLVQANNVMTWGYEGAQLAEAEVGITVPLRRIESYEFNRVAEAIAAGRAAVEPYVEELNKLALPPQEYARWRASIEPVTAGLPIVDRIELRNDSPVHDSTILGRISQPLGEPLDLERLSHDLGRVFELGVFEMVDFGLQPRADGTALVIDARAKPYLPWIIRGGGSYTLSSMNRGRVSIIARALHLEMNDLGGELRIDGAIGVAAGAGVEWYQPLEHSRTLFAASRVRFRSDYTSVFDGSTLQGHFTANRWLGNLDLGLSVSRFGEFRIGYQGGYVGSKTADGDLQVPELYDTQGAVQASIAWDTLDNHAVPHTGFGGRVGVHGARPGLGDDNDYTQVVGHLLGAFKAERWVLQYRLQGGSSTDGTPYYQQFAMGGLRNGTGLAEASLRGNAFAIGGAGLLYLVRGLNLPYASQWYLGLWGDVGNAWDLSAEARWDDLLYGGAASVLLETAFGPLEAGYGYTSAGRGTLYLQIGLHFGDPYNN